MEGSKYSTPPQAITALVDAPSTPLISISRDGKTVLCFGSPQLAFLKDISQPARKLAGLHLTKNFMRADTRPYTSLGLLQLPAWDQELKDFHCVMQSIENMPSPPKILTYEWNNAGSMVAFANIDEHSNRLSLYVVAVGWKRAFGPIDLELPLTAVLGSPLSWVSNSELIVRLATHANTPMPVHNPEPSQPITDSSVPGKKRPARTLQNLLKTPEDDEDFRYFATSSLHFVRIETNASTRALTFVTAPITRSTTTAPSTNVPFSGLILENRISPDEKYLLVNELVEPFSHNVSYLRFAQRTSVYTLNDKHCQFVRVVADLEIAESVPPKHNACRTGRRHVTWCSTFDAALFVLEALDGGDPSVAATHRDVIGLLSSRDNFTEIQTVMQFSNRVNSIHVLEGSPARFIFEERWYQTRNQRIFLVKQKAATESSIATFDDPVVVFDRSFEDTYNDPGNFLLAASSNSFRKPMMLGRDWIFLEGTGASPIGNRPFLDVFQIDGETRGATHRLFWSDHDHGMYEHVVSILPTRDPSNSPWCEFPQNAQKLRLLVRFESPNLPPNYRIQEVALPPIVRNNDGNGIVPETELSSVVLTNFPHPSKELVGASKHLVRYRRIDGIDLGGVLHLPPGYDINDPNRKKLPLLLWAYPHEFKDAAAASQVRDSPFRFSHVTPLSSLVWLTQGYAVLQDPAFPIVSRDGNSASANDTFIDQLVASAVAAVKHVCLELAVGDESRVAIGGHSYGAFMAANLLCHAPNLFQCGIARSGAFNRTLTPFGFQSEERTFWDAKDLYVTMSPFVHADKIQNPLLLIHGQDDENSGTFPEQSERMFRALQGLGKTSRLVLLPKEGHGYRARESVLHCLAETHSYLHVHCTLSPASVPFPLLNYTSSIPSIPSSPTPATPASTTATPATPGAKQFLPSTNNAASVSRSRTSLGSGSALVLAGVVATVAMVVTRSRM
eukprot:c10996_g1_i2.p1 GENE.c10996_g1_i2~~c10996_g1_i2.p1  ORF type:complete len:966 (+),score=225.30 c10996_g1_i2:32-2899(+)